MTNLDLPISDARFIVVDVESTGGTSGEHRLIEIAMVVVEDGEIVRRYETLVNPHENIPHFIQRMTGIKNDMVKGAPEEEDVLVPVLEELQNERAVFVAHNVGFDWGFVSRGAERWGSYLPETTKLCTCKLSRRLHRDLKKHDLASVAEHCDVVIEGRHRAMGDAEATAEALKRMLELAEEDHDATTLGDLVGLQYAPRKRPREETQKRSELENYLRELPDEPGVYYFLTKNRKLLYVGKAKSLVKRVRTYFHDAPLHGRRVSRMIRYIRHIKWEPTGTELGALLLESREIKTQRPSYNVALKKFIAPYFLRFTVEDFPRLELVEGIDDDGAEYFGPLRSRTMAERIHAMMQQAYQIRSCEGALQPAADFKPCFDYHVKKCAAPCALHQTIDEYRTTVAKARDHLASVDDGLVTLLQRRMDSAAEETRFEMAAMYRDGIREIERLMMHDGEAPLAVHDLNIVILVPTSDRYATVELYAMRSGRLHIQRVVGLRARNTELLEDLQKVYAGPPPNAAFSERELDELRIITSWLHQRREKSHVFTVDSEKIAQQLEAALDTVSAKRAEAPSEYSQIPEDHGYED